MRILSIGNSFSQDAQRYLNAVALANGKQLKNINLYIGGCSLKKHYINCLENNKSYGLEYKGESVGISVAIKDALISDDWDYVTLQQASPLSHDKDSYTPYIEFLKDYVKRYCPKAKILLHQTWAYPDFSAINHGFGSSEEMFNAVKAAYDNAIELINPDGVIRSGEAMIKAYRKVGDDLYRDRLHAGYGLGRYILALVWYRHLFGKAVDFKGIDSFDVEITEDEKELAYEIAFGE